MRVEYISYNGLTEPLGRRQVLPYVLGLAGRGWSLTVVSFEKENAADPDSTERVRSALNDARVTWVPLAYHGRPSVLATAYDIANGVRATGLQRGRPALLHARATVPAAMSYLLSRSLRVPWVFDVRGLMAEEYAEAGHWRRSGLLYRLTAWVEARLVRQADGVVLLSQQIMQRHPFGPAGNERHSVEVIFCSADGAVFKPDPHERLAHRARLGIGDRPLLVYSGTVGSWYRLSEVLGFFSAFRRELPPALLLILTRQEALAHASVARAGLGGSTFVVSADPDAVPKWLAAADAGIHFLGQSLSAAAASPTKFGEYLASGLPVVTNPWIGDAEALRHGQAWILVDRFSEDAYQAAAKKLVELLATPCEARTAAQTLARQHFSLSSAIDAYDRLYRRVLGRGP